MSWELVEFRHFLKMVPFPTDAFGIVTTRDPLDEITRQSGESGKNMWKKWELWEKKDALLLLI